MFFFGVRELRPMLLSPFNYDRKGPLLSIGLRATVAKDLQGRDLNSLLIPAKVAAAFLNPITNILSEQLA